MTEEIIIAGFGGQGVLVLGQFLAYSGMIEDRNVSWFPSYGPEQRGGTCNCSVVVSESEVGAPVVSEPSSVIVMNLPSLDKFESKVGPGGLLVINSSLIERKSTRTDIDVLYVPANEAADTLGDLRVANMVALGAFLAARPIVSIDSVINSMKKVLPERRHGLIPLNLQALEKGKEYAQKVS